MSESIALSRSLGGVADTRLELWSPTFEEMASNLGRPTVGKKDGPYFVRGPFNGVAARADEHIAEANVVILDADKRIDPGTGELHVGAPHPSMVHEALRDGDVQHVIYTSHSHGSEMGNRYRIVVPARMGSDHRALLATVDHLIDVIADAGILLAPASENYGWSQPWYLPRLRSGGAEFLHYVHDTDERLDVHKIVTQWLKGQPPDVDVAPQVPTRPNSGASLIDRYVRQHNDPSVLALWLQGRGYRLMRSGMVNGAVAYRFLAPGSGSGTPGVALFRAKSGIWRVVSFHGEHDPLAERNSQTGKPLAHDAFDLLRILDHGGDLREALRAVDPRPTIQLVQGGLDQATQLGIAALADQTPPTVLQRGTMLVRVAHLPEMADVYGVRLPKGSATVVPLSQADLRLRLSRAANWQSPKKAKGPTTWMDVDPPADVVASVAASAGEWDRLPVLLAISEPPILRPDGTVMDTAGYDPDTRLYYEGRAPALKLQDHIHRDEARAAADYLLEPFAEFPFVDPVLDRSVVLAYTLTLVQRPQLVLAPLFGVSARSPGTGKGLLTEACNLIARGRDAAIMPPTSGNNAEEETRKRITALLLQGAPSVVLDNWTSAVGGDSLNVLLTAPEWTDRLLGGNETITVPARVTWAATGNNLIVYGDMVRRTLLMSLDAKTERPEQRRFKITNLGKHILQRRGELLSAAYTILRGYRAAGSPEQEGPLLGRFEEWSRAVAAPIRWLGLPDPVLSQERLRATDPETARLSALLNAWWDLLGDRTVTLGQLLEEINGFETVVPESESGGERRAALREALEDVAGERGQINRRKLGWFLRHTDQRVCDGYILFRSTGNVAKYRVAKAEGGGP